MAWCPCWRQPYAAFFFTDQLFHRTRQIAGIQTFVIWFKGDQSRGAADVSLPDPMDPSVFDLMCGLAEVERFRFDPSYAHYCSSHHRILSVFLKHLLIKLFTQLQVWRLTWHVFQTLDRVSRSSPAGLWPVPEGGRTGNVAHVGEGFKTDGFGVFTVLGLRVNGRRWL